MKILASLIVSAAALIASSATFAAQHEVIRLSAKLDVAACTSSENSMDCTGTPLSNENNVEIPLNCTQSDAGVTYCSGRWHDTQVVGNHFIGGSIIVTKRSYINTETGQKIANYTLFAEVGFMQSSIASGKVRADMSSDGTLQDVVFASGGSVSQDDVTYTPVIFIRQL
jgi:hypothetical protein